MQINGHNVIWSAAFICRDNEIIEESLPINDTTSGTRASINFQITSEPHPVNPDNRMEFALTSPAQWRIRCFGFNNSLGESLGEPVTIGQIALPEGNFKFTLLFTHQKIGSLHLLNIQLRSEKEVSNG